MTTEQLRKFHKAQPFRPFSIHLADGRSIRVSHPEMLAYSPTGSRTCAVFTEPEAAEVIDLLLVTSLKPLNGKSSTKAT